MSYPKKIIKLEPSGYNPDQPPQDGSQWEIVQNMTTIAGKTVSAPGYTRVYANTFNVVNNGSTNTILSITNLETLDANFWIYHSNNKSYAVQGNTHTNITANTTTTFITPVDTPSYWTSGVLNGVAFVNNRLNIPMYWTGNTAGPFLQLPGWEPSAKARRMVPHKNFLFALGITNTNASSTFIDGKVGEFPEMVAWSSQALPGQIPATWLPAASNDAGSTILAETGGELVTALSLRDSLIIYKKSATYSARQINDNNIFQFDTLFTNKGALGTHSVADINGAHFVVGDGDVYITDGSQYQSVADGFIKSTLFGQLSANNVDQLFVTYKPTTHSVLISFPSLGSNTVDTALEYNLNDGKWGSRELTMAPATAKVGYVSDTSTSQVWDNANTVWDDANVFWNTRSFSTAATSVVWAGTSLYKGDVGSTKNGSPLQFKGIITNIDFEDPSRIKYVKAIYPSIYGQPGTVVNFRVGKSSSVDGSITYTDNIPFTVGVDNKIDCRVLGKLIAIEVNSLSQIMINNIVLEADVRGYR